MKSPRIIWLLLVMLTLLSVGIAEKEWLHPVSFVAIVLIAAAKARMVILHYMEASHAPLRWRFLYETWNFCMAAVVIIGQFMPMQPPPS